MLAITDDSKLLRATIQTGSNMDVEWFAYGNESQREISPGNPQEVTSYHGLTPLSTIFQSLVEETEGPGENHRPLASH
jgi:hypothetical protein